jgi:hypothetical protein
MSTAGCEVGGSAGPSGAVAAPSLVKLDPRIVALLYVQREDLRALIQMQKEHAHLLANDRHLLSPLKVICPTAREARHRRVALTAVAEKGN